MPRPVLRLVIGEDEDRVDGVMELRRAWRLESEAERRAFIREVLDPDRRPNQRLPPRNPFRDWDVP